MKEVVAHCTGCGKILYCKDGFFEGELDRQKSFCFTCFEQLHEDFTEEETGEFISRLNRKPDQHIGYCGTNAKEVADVLMQDFSDLSFNNSFAVLKENGKIIAALGADWDSKEKTGELWGPFSLAEDEKWQEQADILWRLLQHKINQKGMWYGFYNEQNQQAEKWISRMGGVKQSSEVILHASTYRSSSIYSGKAAVFTAAFKVEFKRLHNTVFPAAYFSADDILTRINDSKRLFIMADGEDLLGYVYVEAVPDHGEGAIEFIAVDSKSRGRGVGTALLQKAASFLFDEMNIKDISICVSAENKAAIQMYKNNAFLEKHRMDFYKLKDDSN
ncbi:GNAT family N-acetyltransferase [Jeotgalibacillus sp. S-D1]|uniref:GNAT family N-acetyltransferase n=1 Tax=Jeotgalibacillus sp. S-D1 TaxID=2552189 RepID=UPI001059727C|nr:GNAT family N-acetyltransferase [Jeotgalibacillus sp. S-D1]TDL31542.1 GNAT family N-acetyltransferase [Jeotgalibacillus sp. S-D1]